MSQTIKCPACRKPTEIPSGPGDGTYYNCGCPTGKALAQGHADPRIQWR